MKIKGRKLISITLCMLLVISMVIPGFSAFAAGLTLEITKDGAVVTEKTEVQEYRSVQFDYELSETAPDGSYVIWESNLPLLADVDENGKVTGYDYSKAAVIQLWLDEEVRSKPVVGNAMADAIEKALNDSGIDLETANTDMIVAVVSGVSPELGESLRTVLDNMNVKITATLYSSSDTVLAEDTVEVVVTQSLVANAAPTGVHITNKKKVPTKVAVGKTIQLYGAVTPVRLKLGTKFSVGGMIADTESKKHATVTSDGFVTFTSVGTATVKVKPDSTLYAAVNDTIKFEIVDPSELAVTDFNISGELSVSEGETTQLSISELVPAGAYTGDIVWSSADPSIAVVDDNGIVTGLDGGTINKKVDITATIGDVSKTVNVTVKRGSITGTISGIEINGESVLGISETSKYTSTVYPSRFNDNKSVVREWGLVDSATGESFFATSETPAESELAIITADGTLTPKTNGLIKIIARATYNNTVVENTKEIISGNAITDFTITGANEVTENKTIQLSVENIVPDDYDEALLSTLKWSVEDSNIASVDENGVVKGLDGGGVGKTKTTTVYATIGGLKKSFEITVKGSAINYVTSALINGPDCVIKDFPVQYEAQFTPERLNISKTLWGLTSDEGTPPWTASNTLSSSGCMENSIASVTDSGLVTGKTAGETTLHLFGRRNLTSNNETSREIKVVEIEPASISITAPVKTEYVEGQTQLDLTGLNVELTYNRSDIEEYYGDTSGMLTDAQLKVSVSDYSVSEIKQSILDSEQYIVVSVVRAGKTYRGIFSITLKSKELTSIEIVTAPQYKYVEGVETLNLSEMTVKANYSNAESEFINGYYVNSSEFDPNLFDEEQTITVGYSHAGRSAYATFPVIVYGIPVVSVSTGEYQGGWTNGTVTFSLDSTHKVDGIKYYYKTYSDSNWVELENNTITIDTDINETYYFKAVNGKGIESAETIGYAVSIDNITPAFELIPEITELTNLSYNVQINMGSIGASGIASILLNGDDITGSDSFTVDENGIYFVKITSVSGLSDERSITVTNIDKLAPAVISVGLEHKNTGGFAKKINELTFGLFFKEQIEITIEAVDYGVAGINKIEYRFLDENSVPVSDWAVYDENNKPQQDPEFKGYIEARAVDNAGNESSSYYSDGYVIDNIPPADIEVTATTADGEYINNTWTSKDVTILLESSAFSDIYRYYFKLNDGSWTEMSGNSITVSEQGEYTYQFKAVSYSELESPVTEFNVKIDKATPVIRVDFEGTFGRWTSGNVKFSFSLLNESISGVTYYYNNGEGWSEITSGNEINLNDNVNSTYSFKAVNGAGIESNPSDSYKVMIDNVVPDITFDCEVTDDTYKPYDVSLDITCGNAGLDKVNVNGEDITGQNKFTVSENGLYVFVVTGKNGMTTTKTLEINNFVELEINITDMFFSAVNYDDYKGYYPDDVFGLYFSGPVEIEIYADCNVGSVGGIEYKIVDENMMIVEQREIRGNTASFVIDYNFKGFILATAANEDLTVVQPNYKWSAGFTVDTTSPSAPVVNAKADNLAYNGEWCSSDIDITLASDSYSGVKNYLYSVDGGEFKVSDSGKLTISEEGVHTYSFKAVSKTGFESAETQFVTKIESSVPAINVKTDGTIGQKTGEDVVFTLSASNIKSGVTYYYNNGDGWQKMNSNILTVSDDCDCEYSFKAVNGVGNQSEVSPSYRVIIDKSFVLVELKPIINVQVNGTTDGFTYTPVEFTLTSAQTQGSATYYYNDGSAWRLVGGDTFIAHSNGTTVYKFKVIDESGKESLESVEYKVMFDNVMPAVSVTLENENYVNTATAATVDAVVGVSGIKNVSVNGSDITDNMKFTVDKNGDYIITATSGSGLTVTEVLSVNNIDTSAPAINSIDVLHKNSGGFARAINTLTFGLFFNEKTEISITATDFGNSGIKEIKYRLVNNIDSPSGTWLTYDENNKPCIDSSYKGYVQAVAYDKAGNSSQPVLSAGFTVDLSAPDGMKVTATSGGNKYDGQFTAKDIVLKPNATAFSDIYCYMYSVDNGEWNIMTSDSVNAADGVHNYSFKAISNSNLESNVATVTTKREAGIPKLNVIVSGKIGEWTSGSVVFTLNAENVESGAVYYFNNGSGWNKMDSNVLAVSENINATYKFKCINGAGSESAESQTYKVMIDSTISYDFAVFALTDNGQNIPFGAEFENEVTIILEAQAFSDVYKYQYSVNGGEWTDLTSNEIHITQQGVYVYSFRAVSNAGVYSDILTVVFSVVASTDPNEPSTDPNEPSTDPNEPSTDPNEPSTDVQFKLGDVNLDGKITLVDAKLTLKHIANTTALTGIGLKAADVNEDGKITIVDAKWILQMIAGSRPA